ncbi:hypothetical protein M4I32_13875 [Microbacterium sp. LRZ72]|uniref:hypothetical protein n=1 Tax=Microbacterium sp. LRZ72 TaxID=2942481 RepID=UPI0029A7B448|nr:hypothetical protein [Microbacterium sp. LRZ72]MDX2377886.1 hypothetical protein [Microbacterium sp. LRZ72]
MTDHVAPRPVEDFRLEVMMNLANGDIDLDVVDAAGRRPVIVALDDEHLATLIRRIENVGGYANVFARGTHVRQVSVIRSESALFENEADDLSVEAPAGTVSVGAFLDYVSIQAHGVKVPAVLRADEPGATARHARDVAFA